MRLRPRKIYSMVGLVCWPDICNYCSIHNTNSIKEITITIYDGFLILLLSVCVCPIWYMRLKSHENFILRLCLVLNWRQPLQPWTLRKSCKTSMKMGELKRKPMHVKLTIYRDFDDAIRSNGKTKCTTSSVKSNSVQIIMPRTISPLA